MCVAPIHVSEVKLNAEANEEEGLPDSATGQGTIAGLPHQLSEIKEDFLGPSKAIGQKLAAMTAASHGTNGGQPGRHQLEA